MSSSAPTVFVVDDELPVRQSLSHLLRAAVRSGIEKDRIARRTETEVAEIRRRLATLTPREYEVLCHVVSGKLNKQIAADLGTVEKTVKVHRARVMEKVKAASLAELVRLAHRAGIQPLQ